VFVLYRLLLNHWQSTAFHPSSSTSSACSSSSS
jgi:hypothetical protein